MVDFLPKIKVEIVVDNDEKAEKIIDKMLVMEKETPYWGEFELMKTKFSSQFSQNKYCLNQQWERYWKSLKSERERESAR